MDNYDILSSSDMLKIYQLLVKLIIQNDPNIQKYFTIFKLAIEK